MYPISEQLLKFNRPGGVLSPIGFVIHSTDTANATAQNEHDYFNSGDRQASVHYFADWTQIIRTIPENEVAWHAGPSANARYLSVEMCEPTDDTKFQEVWNRTVFLVANACVRYGWTTGPNVFSHRGISAMYHETNHQDPIQFLANHQRTWEQLMSAIDAEMVAQVAPVITGPTMILDAPTPSRGAPVIHSEPTALNFSYPNNAKVSGDSLYIRDINGNTIPGRYVSDGDNITVLDVSYSRQLVLVEYPTSNGVKSGYVSNKLIRYFSAKWRNGSTKETVYDENGVVLGSLSPRETAILLYKKGDRFHVVYNTDKGSNTKSGYVIFAGL